MKDYKKIYALDKVYILVDEWSEPLWWDLKIFVFSDLEKACQKMEERRNDFLSHEDLDYIETDKKLYKRWQNDEIVLDMYIDEKPINDFTS